MMIYLYTGTPGSGKTCHAARDILMASFKGKQVICNMALRPTAKQIKTGKLPIFWDDTQISPQRLYQYAKENHKKGKEDQTLLVIDECHILFNCRAFNQKGREEWVKFFSLHRHFGYKIILIAQYDRMIDRQIRVMAEYEVKHRCVNNFKLIGMFITLLRMRVFLAIEKWYGANNEVNSREFIIGRKRLYNVYDSYANFAAWDDVTETACVGGRGSGGTLPPTQGGAAPTSPPTEDTDSAISPVAESKAETGAQPPLD